MSKIKFGNVEEIVVTREEFSLSKAREVLKGKTIAIIGYGVQGPAQGLNLRDNGFQVIVGQRAEQQIGGQKQNSPTWKKAITDGWIPNETLFSVEEACKRGDIILSLLSDAGQIEAWPSMKKSITPGKTLCFSHGFAVTFKEHTKVEAPAGVDVILVAPKGSGRTVRKLYLEGKGINSSIAVCQDASGKAWETASALGIAIGSGYLFETTMQKEVVSDLVGERGSLMGAITGIIEAQYEILRAKGHSPSEAYNETVEELTQSLVPLIGESGLAWLYSNCSTTAQRGALDWKNKFRDAVKPVFASLYEEVASGREAKRVIEANSRPAYRAELEEELNQMRNSELGQAGDQVRKLRP